MERSGVENAEFDALLKQALATPDVEKRRVIMAKIQKLMQDEGVIIQPYWRGLYNHGKSNLKGSEMHISFEIHPTDLHWA